MRADREPYPEFRCIDLAAERRKRLTAEEREARGLPGPVLALAIGIGLTLYFIGIAVTVGVVGWWFFIALAEKLTGGL